MEIIEINLNEHFKVETPVVACIGYFDGLHIGHQALIAKSIEVAKQHQCHVAMISFDPDPWTVTKNLKDVKHINSADDKVALLTQMGVNLLIVLKFTKDMAGLSSEDFVQLLVNRLNLKALITGFDFHYGAFGKGNTDTLKTQAKGYFETYVVKAINDHKGKISSSRIESEIIEGHIPEASKMLGYDYFIQGKVVKGRQKGRKIGFPTANIEYDDHILLPKKGVYAGCIELKKVSYPAIINLGHNPTFNFQQKNSLEAHILNFHQMIYDQEVKIIFKKFIRDEQKFDSVNDLVEQISCDCSQVLTINENL